MNTPPKLRVQASCRLLIVIASLAFLTLVLPAPAQVLGPYVPPSNAITPEAKSDSQPPMRLAERTPIEKPLVLRPASEGARDQLDALEAWNRAGKRPTRIGFSRPLPEPITAVFGSSSVRAESAEQVEPHAVRATTGAGSVVWATKMTVLGAYGIRLHLTEVHVPAGTRFWTYGPDGRAIGFGLELLSPLGDIWTPTIFDQTVFLEVEIPSAQVETLYGFVLLDASEIVPPSRRGTAVTSPESLDSPSCLEDAACITTATFGFIAQARRAVALLEFISGGNSYLCTGTLLNNTRSDLTPYLLTAHHCLPTQAEVSSLTAVWDYVDTTCGGSPPSLGSLPRSNGGTLLATAPASDFSFVLLFSIPPGRALMGWDPRATSVGAGTKLYRVSHPAPGGIPLAQGYSETLVDTASGTCAFSEVGIAARPQFIYSSTVTGDTYGGSSGSVAMLADGSVVGQLVGGCPAITDSCTQFHEITDGAFSQSYPFIAQWLNPAGGPQPCVSNATTLCLNAGRFRVTLDWTTSQGQSGVGMAIPQTSDTGLFWFFSSNNVEAIIKVLNACSFTAAPRYWVFAAGLTNVRTTITVTDTRTGLVRTYSNPQGTAFQPIQDTSAFATCP